MQNPSPSTFLILPSSHQASEPVRARRPRSARFPGNACINAGLGGYCLRLVNTLAQSNPAHARPCMHAWGTQLVLEAPSQNTPGLLPVKPYLPYFHLTQCHYLHGETLLPPCMRERSPQEAAFGLPAAAGGVQPAQLPDQGGRACSGAPARCHEQGHPAGEGHQRRWRGWEGALAGVAPHGRGRRGGTCRCVASGERGHPAGALAGNRAILSTCPLQDLRTANEALANELVRVSSSGEKVWGNHVWAAPLGTVIRQKCMCVQRTH